MSSFCSILLASWQARLLFSTLGVIFHRLSSLEPRDYHVVFFALHTISQVKLGEILGVSKQSVSNWENDNIQPSIEILMKLAEYFGVSTDFLLGFEEKRTLDVTGLSLEEVAHIQQIIHDMNKK